MSLDSDTKRWLNLLRKSPRFVLKEKPDGGARVTSPQAIPSYDGFYWVHGKTILRSGRVLESVFRLDTDSGGEMCEVYWWLKGSWYDHHDPRVRAALGSEEDIFPFDWKYSVPLEEDSHSS